jgi:hypothetical protein
MLHSRLLAPLAGLLLAAAALTATAGINTWSTNGPDSGWPLAVAIQPTNPQLALAATQRGLYRTVDGGANWMLVGEQISSARSIAFDPVLPVRVFVADSSQLWVSLDSGLNYALAQSPEFGVRQVELSSSGVIYLQTFSARMFKSVDHGSTWTPCGRPWGNDAASNSFGVDPNPVVPAQDRLFIEVLRGAGQPSGTWRSTDGCSNWLFTGAGSPGGGTDGRAYHFSVKTGDSNRVLAATNLGVQLSTDGGGTWNVVTVSPAWWVEYDRVTPNKAVAMTEITHSMRSVDSGDTWVFGDALSAPGEASFALDPQVSGRMLVATQNGMFQSLDSGLNFTLRNHGMQAGSVSHFSVADDGTVYASFYPGAAGIYRRNAQTGQWSPVNNAALWLATIASTNYISTVATAPSNSSIVYSGNYYSSLSRSTNSGVAWQQSHPAFLGIDALPYAVAVDPDNAMVAHAATSNRGMFKTIDGGISWAEKDSGLPLGVTMVAAARNSDLVYAVAADPNILYPGSIYKSTDAGETWAMTGAVPIAPGQGIFNALVIDPKNPNVVYAPFHNGVYQTINGGTSWALMNFPGVSDTQIGGYSVSIDPQFSSTVLVSHTLDNAGLARTVDGGAHWERIDFLVGSPNTRPLTYALTLPTKPSQIVAFAIGGDVEEYELATDLSVGGLGIAPALAANMSFDYPINVKNYGPHGASPAKLSVDFPSWLTPTVPGNCTRLVQTLNCDIPALNVDDLVQITVPFAVTATGSGTLTASLVGHESELITANNSFAQGITATERSDLALSFTPSAVTIDHDGSTMVVAKVTNHGPSPSTGTTLTLQIPAGLSWTAAVPSTGTCTRAGQAINCAFGTLAPDAIGTVSLSLVGSAVGTQVISGAADGLGADTGTDQNASVAVVVRPVGDVAVSLAESDDPVIVGGPLVYTVTLRNVAGDAGSAAVVMQVSGAALTDVGGAPGVNCTANLQANVASCDVPTLAAGGTAIAYVHVVGPVAGIATATATASYGGRDNNGGNDTATIGTLIRVEGDIGVEITDSVDPAPVYSPFTYTVSVHNAGPNAGPVNVAIPVTGASISSVASPAGSCTVIASTANCTLTSLVSGASATITVTVFAAAPGTVSATATATFGGVDTVATNDSATAETVARAVSDIGVTITESADPVNAGTQLMYRVTLTGSGPSPGDVHLAVPVTGGTVTSATASQGGVCGIASGTVTCDFAPLQFSPSTVDIVLNSTVAGTVTAAATATFSGTDPEATNNAVTVTTTVNPAPIASPSGSGGKSGGGGGGRVDWLTALLLGVLAAVQVQRRSRRWPRASTRSA